MVSNLLDRRITRAVALQETSSLFAYMQRIAQFVFSSRFFAQNENEYLWTNYTHVGQTLFVGMYIV